MYIVSAILLCRGEKMKVKLNKIQCKRCNHEWTPRKPEVITCPKCRSPYWNREREHDN
jgi:Zn finger protein HypA/HybF involved in hydrogenase expression